MNQRQRAVIDYGWEENRVLREGSLAGTPRWQPAPPT